ncbi:MAG: DUF697 domain-containing protein [Phycisphaerales bacterium JB040]
MTTVPSQTLPLPVSPTPALKGPGRGKPHDEDAVLPGEEELAAELESLEITRSEQSWLDPARWLGGSMATAFVVLVVGLTGLFVLSQTLSVVSQIQSLPEAWRWAGWGLLGLGLALVGYAGVRLGGVYLRLKATPNLSAGALDQLAQRARLRDASDERVEAATASLKNLLEKHRLDTDKVGKELLRLGLREEELANLRDARAHLLDTHASANPELWVREYRSLYVGSLDRAAGRLIRRRSMLCGAKTAALPNGGIDTAVVLTHSYLLVADLCRLYRVRTGRRGTVAIMWRALVGVLVAGQLEDAVDAAGEQLGGLAGGASTGILARAGSAVAGKVVGKAAEGMVNAAFLYRLGRATVKRLRPVA